ncbi:hypothetical protein J7444_17720 [Labrenzia sp. R4_1]|uniref:hypothetical protein n=1 Tax=Labrenzia sp. R4_1 TaxID=2821106 RepID=UPI001ADB3679|nr:hypothetical protein [Labrenzia sp. R4_1]MBO9426580.1 hypothetical protein [Labrenzia sp. R4_1]
MIEAGPVLRGGYEIGPNSEFAMRMVDLAEEFSVSRGLPADPSDGTGSSETTELSKLDYSVGSLNQIDRFYRAIPEDLQPMLFELLGIQWDEQLKPLYSSVAYFGEVIRRHSKDGYEWSDFGIFEDRYALDTWGEAAVPPTMNLVTADRTRAFAVSNYLMERAGASWKPIAEEISSYADMDAYLSSVSSDFIIKSV